MNIKIMYHSSTGNTQKLANAIADTLNISAEPVQENPSIASTPIDLLFIGGGIYFGKPSKRIIAFIKQLDPQIIKNVAVFATYGGQAKISSDIQKLLKEKGLHVIQDSFICKGQSWFFINRNHPNEEDIHKVSNFANSIVKKINEQLQKEIKNMK